MNSLLVIFFLNDGINFLKSFNIWRYSYNLNIPTVFLTNAAAHTPTRTFKTVTEINLVDNANAATPVAPFIAAHLNFLKFSLFFILVYEYPNAAIDEIVPSCYYEFAKRYSDSTGQIYQGFVTASADKIFESTNK